MVSRIVRFALPFVLALASSATYAQTAKTTARDVFMDVDNDTNKAVRVGNDLGALSAPAAITCDTNTHYTNEVPPRICTTFDSDDDSTYYSNTGMNIQFDHQDGKVVPTGPPPSGNLQNCGMGGNNAVLSYSMCWDPVIELEEYFGWQYGYFGTILNGSQGPFPAFNQFITWTGTPYASTYVQTTVQNATLANGQPNYNFNVSLAVINQTYLFTGCTGGGRWRRCHWTPQTINGMSFSVPTN